MKKKFMLEDLDCANCAAKLEAAIQKVDGVEEAGVNFLTQKLTVVIADDRFEEVMDEVVKAGNKAVPECRIIR